MWGRGLLSIAACRSRTAEGSPLGTRGGWVRIILNVFVAVVPGSLLCKTRHLLMVLSLKQCDTECVLELGESDISIFLSKNGLLSI